MAWWLSCHIYVCWENSPWWLAYTWRWGFLTQLTGIHTANQDGWHPNWISIQCWWLEVAKCGKMKWWKNFLQAWQTPASISSAYWSLGQLQVSWKRRLPHIVFCRTLGLCANFFVSVMHLKRTNLNFRNPVNSNRSSPTVSHWEKKMKTTLILRFLSGTFFLKKCFGSNCTTPGSSQRWYLTWPSLIRSFGFWHCLGFCKFFTVVTDLLDSYFFWKTNHTICVHIYFQGICLCAAISHL
jgi:hypothetical protein